MPLLRAFWETAAELDPEAVETVDERARMRFDRRGELGELWRRVGLGEVEEGEIRASAAYEDFDDLWEPFTQGVGPAGAYAAALDAERREELRREYRLRLSVPEGPFELEARAWFAVGRA